MIMLRLIISVLDACRSQASLGDGVDGHTDLEASHRDLKSGQLVLVDADPEVPCMGPCECAKLHASLMQKKRIDGSGHRAFTDFKLYCNGKFAY